MKMTLLDKLNIFREGYINHKYLSPDLQRTMSEPMKNNIKKYGTRFVADLYEPHISISFVPHEKVSLEELKNELPNFTGTYYCNDIIVFKQKESGRSIEMLQRISF